MNPDAQLAAFDEGTLDLGLTRPLPPEQRPYFEEEVVYTDYLVAVLPQTILWLKTKSNWKN
jgi:hypothetical protein